jgi:hypothetical protein
MKDICQDLLKTVIIKRANERLSKSKKTRDDQNKYKKFKNNFFKN